MTLTYAFFRGFEDLGPKMTESYILFVNADFILADGSYRNLLPSLLRGDRLVFSPSYCTIAEAVVPQLESAKDESRCLLAMKPRDMADLIIKYRHYTVRAKTVNQRFFSLNYIEQFYWIANETTLLAHQLPIAIVAMKPEVYLKEVEAYWDYGVIADFCPSMNYTVLGDSDDFLMLELRSRDTAKKDIHPGWPEPKEIAGKLATFITDYKRILGRERLCVHSRDLPDNINEVHGELDRYVDTVYGFLPAALLPHHDHPQWKHHFARFNEARISYLAMHATTAPPIQSNQARLIAERTHIPDSADAPQPFEAASLSQSVLQEAQHYLFGAAPNFRPWHYLHSSTRFAYESARRSVANAARVLHFTDSLGRFRPRLSPYRITYLPSTLLDAPEVMAFKLTGEAPFDACFVEVDILAFKKLPIIYDQVRPHLRSGAVLTILLLNTRGITLPMQEPDFIRDALPVCGPTKVAYSGSWASNAAILVKYWSEQQIAGDNAVARLFVVGIGMCLAAPFALLGTFVERRRTFDGAFNPPRNITSITIEIQIG
jgi:hypothetical protein